jgi:hypothetical protein
MQEPGMIAAYVESLEEKLGFNPSLSRRVRREVEDHLWEAVEAARPDDAREAVERAIAAFGNPNVIAAQFATVWLAKQTQKVGITVILVIAGVFVAMKARVAWYAATQWGLADEVRAVAKLVGLVDACAFWLSLVAGIAGCAYLILRRAPAAGLYAAHYRQLRRVLLLSAVSAAALIVSVIGDGALTALRLMAREFSTDCLIPISSMAIEIVCAGVLILTVRNIAVRMARATTLLAI